jgi:hypothetical protein
MKVSAEVHLIIYTLTGVISFSTQLLNIPYLQFLWLVWIYPMSRFVSRRLIDEVKTK